MTTLLPYQLWRQDDNGNRLLIGRYPTLDAARQRLAELTRTQHKQTYWIDKTGAAETLDVTRD